MAESERSQEDRETAAVLTPPSSQEKEESTVLEQTELVQKALEDALLASGIGKEIDSEQQDSNQQKTEGSNRWIDITEQFTGAAVSLNVGELIHESSFSLYDAMSAIELTDSKMDAIVQWDRYPGYPRSLKEAVGGSWLKLQGHAPSELVGIIDEVLSCICTWLDGHTLAQTVFTCLYLLDVTQCEGIFLRAVSVTMVRTVEYLREMIAKGGVYMEDEQQIVYVGFDMLNSYSDETVLATLKVAKDRLVSILKNSIAPLNERSTSNNILCTEEPHSVTSKLAREWNKEYTEALLVRIKFIRSFFILISSLSHRTRENVATSEQELSMCLTYLKSINDTLSLGKQLKPNDPLDLGFHPLINQHLLPPSYREYHIMSRQESITFLQSILSHFPDIYKIGRYNSLNELFSAVISLSSVDYSPNVIVRSLIAQLCLNNDRSKLFGSKSIETMIKEEVRSLFNPPSLNPRSPVSTTPLAVDIVDRFLGNMHLPFVGLLRVYCQHRARQRSMIAKYLDTICEIQQEAESVDQQLHKLTLQIDPQRQHLSCYCTWLVYYVSKLFVDYILLGFEYSLYSAFEIHYVFWYLEYSYGWQQMTLKTATKLLCQEPQLHGKNKKKLKGKKRELPKEREVEVAILNVKRSVCIGLMRAYEALMLDKKIKVPKFEFGSEALVFRNRFLPFSAVVTPQPLAYSDYKELAGIQNYKGSGINLYEAASRHFVSAKLSLESLNLSHNKEIEQLLKVIKTNVVIMNLAATGHKKDSMEPPNLDFSLHREFPIIRIN